MYVFAELLRAKEVEKEMEDMKVSFEKQLKNEITLKKEVCLIFVTK